MAPNGFSQTFRTRLAAAAEAVIVREIASAALPRAPLIRAAPAALGTLAKQGYSQAEIHALVVPKRTLARRQAANEPLSIEETDKALRLERVASLATRVFGSADKANRWLRKPKRQLDGGRRWPSWAAKRVHAWSRRCCSVSTLAWWLERAGPCASGASRTTPIFPAKAASGHRRAGTLWAGRSCISPNIRRWRCWRFWWVWRSMRTICRPPISFLKSTCRTTLPIPRFAKTIFRRDIPSGARTSRLRAPWATVAGIRKHRNLAGSLRSSFRDRRNILLNPLHPDARRAHPQQAASDIRRKVFRGAG